MVVGKSPAKRTPQISLSALMVVMLIFVLMSIALFYAGRIEEVQQELSLYFGITSATKGEASRRAHLIFLIFTYSSPLLMALVLSTALTIMRRKRLPTTVIRQEE